MFGSLIEKDGKEEESESIRLQFIQLLHIIWTLLYVVYMLVSGCWPGLV